jgi:hypothetical protein
MAAPVPIACCIHLRRQRAAASADLKACFLSVLIPVKFHFTVSAFHLSIDIATADLIHRSTHLPDYSLNRTDLLLQHNPGA